MDNKAEESAELGYARNQEMMRENATSTSSRIESTIADKVILSDAGPEPDRKDMPKR